MRLLRTMGLGGSLLAASLTAAAAARTASLWCVGGSCLAAA